MSAPTRTAAAAMDRSDPLSSYRERFTAPSGLCYMDGNSLGPLPRAALDAVHGAAAGDWGNGMVESWEHWIDLPRRAGAVIAPLIGSAPGDVTLADSTSVNLYKLAAAAIDARPDRSVVVTDAGNFPTDRYVLAGLARSRNRELRLVEVDPVLGITPGEVAAAVDDEVALVSFSHVSYRSAAVADMAAIDEIARSRGALTLWDLSHAVGSVPIDLVGTGADLAVGCTYKYLCGGPGAPAFLFVRPDLQDVLQPPIWGWFAHRDQFAFAADFTPASGIERFLVGTPPILSIAAALPGMELVAEAGIDAIRRKSLLATDLMLTLYDAWLEPLGVGLGTPREPARRGSHVAFTHPDGLALTRWLRRERRVVADFRDPDTIRMAVAPPFTRFSEVWDAMAALRDAVAGGEYARSDHAGRVT